jgi:hypothetical protein
MNHLDALESESIYILRETFKVAYLVGFADGNFALSARAKA